jgi:uncharacterized membrane protein
MNPPFTERSKGETIMSERLNGSDTPETSEAFEAGAAAREDRVLAALLYPLPIVALAVLFTEKLRIRFIKYHALQALAYGAAIVVPYVILGFLAHLPFVGWLIGKIIRPFLHLISFLWLSGGIYLGYRAWSGSLVTIPPMESFIRKLLNHDA